MRAFLVFILAALCASYSEATYRKIGAFNIQVFGQSKISKPDVMADLVQILMRYDLVLIQEIRDSAQTAIDVLLKDLNAATGNIYSKIISERLGRTSSKEQYCYFYKHTKFSVIDQYTFPDVRHGDIFEREPFNVKFRHTYTGRQFVFSALHAKPEDAVAEIDALVEVYDDIVETLGTTDVVMMGDLNADCSYVTSSEWASIDTWSDSRFIWPLGHEVDTTVSATHCAYDRFVLAGSMRNLYHGAKVFDFSSEMNLQTNEPKDISDHYPIEITLNL